MKEEVKIFATKDKFEFKRVLSLLRFNNIPYRIKNEYLVYEEKDHFVNDESAEIIIPKIFYLKAFNILVKKEHINQDDYKNPKFEIVDKLEFLYSKIPILKNQNYLKTCLTIFILFGLLVMTITFFSLKLNIPEDLNNGHWCVKKVTINDKTIEIEKTKTALELLNEFQNRCDCYLTFGIDGILIMPDYSNGNYIYSRNKLKINSESKKHTYLNGEFKMKTKFPNIVILFDESTTITLINEK